MPPLCIEEAENSCCGFHMHHTPSAHNVGVNELEICKTSGCVLRSLLENVDSPLSWTELNIVYIFFTSIHKHLKAHPACYELEP